MDYAYTSSQRTRLTAFRSDEEVRHKFSVLNRAALLVVLFVISPQWMRAQSIDGSWSSEGYGLYFDVSGPTLTAFEVTAISCQPSFTAQRSTAETNGDVVFKVVDRPT